MGNVTTIAEHTGDTRIVYSVHGTWWDSIDKVSTKNGLPVCPHCGSPLFEMESEDVWWAGVDRYEANGHPGYRAMMEWARGKCFSTMSALVFAYAASKNDA